jgi:formate hydrogenlyase subunit 3/multisubunit Na+/H+ antiporter MnhD subunit
MLGSRHIGRFLSYSSIAQTGYLMFTLGIGFYYHLDQAISAGLFLYLSIAIMKSQAFLSAGTFQYALHTQDLDQLEGVHRVLPRQAFCFSVALAGLAGIPLLAGFTGKWLAFSAAAAAGDLFALLCLLVFMASTLIGLAGYLPVLVRQYLPRKGRMVTLPETDGPLKVSHWMTAPVMFLSLLIVVLGVFPGPWIDWIEQVVKWMAL